ncbi:MAG: ABC transporter permease [Ignavibacteria bacterium]|jgi:ABC-type antimicrobial peptide transport system permease subunit
MKNKNTPPKLAAWLLSRFLFGLELSEKLGDLEEEFLFNQKKFGLFKAKLSYWRQTLLTIPVCIKNIFQWGIIMFQNYLKIAIRSIKKHKAFSAINILGLAIGMASCFLILLWVQDELSYDKFHKNADNLFILTIFNGEFTAAASPWALVSTLKKDFPEFLKGTRYVEGTRNVRYNEKKFYEKIALADEDFLEMFSFKFIKGNPKTALSNINSILITEEIAVKYFGDEDPIGKTIAVDNRFDLTVTGILENVPSNSHMQFSLLLRPDLPFGERIINGWSIESSSYVLLKPGVNVKEVSGKISDTVIKYDKRYNNNLKVGLWPFNEIHLYSLNGMHPVIYVYIFSGIAVIVLLIACVNFMNLTTAKSSQRAKEIGMRKVIGAQKRDIIKQFFGESIVLSFFALLLAIVCVYLFLPMFNEIAGKELSMDFINNKYILAGLFVIALFTGIISGTYPALYLSSFKPVQVLKNVVFKSGRKNSFRRVLIVFQFSAAIVLIICTSVILKQMEYIRTKDLGFKHDYILRIDLDEQLLQKYETVKKELLKDKDISKVTSATNVPLSINSINPFWWEGKAAGDFKNMNYVCVDFDYFETFDMKMKYGRSFSQNFRSDSINYIINEAALRLTGFEKPIGKKFAMWSNEGEIIGVVRDFNSNSLHDEIKPIAFMIYNNVSKQHIFVKINNKNIPSTIEYIEKTVNAFSPNYIFEYNFLDDDFDKQYKSEERLLDLLKSFTFLSIFISCLGLLGLASFMAEQKRKEIAIRKVLGATVSSVVVNLSKEFFILIAFANLIAWPIAYYFMKNWIESFSFHINIGFDVFLKSGIIAILIALLTTGAQAYNAANRNPVDNLKCE